MWKTTYLVKAKQAQSRQYHEVGKHYDSLHHSMSAQFKLKDIHDIKII